MSIIYSNKIVLDNEVIAGNIVVENGIIKKINVDEVPTGDFLDYTDKYILPGFINISSNNYEKEMKSYYNKYFSAEKILKSLDRISAQSGVTTLFHTFELFDLLEGRSIEDLLLFLKNINDYVKHSLVDHKVHIMFNIGGELIFDGIRDLILYGCVDLITFKGFHNCKKCSYKNQYFVQSIQSRFGLSDDDASKIMDILVNSRENSAIDDISYRIKTAKNTNIKFASSVMNLIKKLSKRYNLDIDIVIDYLEDEELDFIRKNKIKYIYDIDNLANDEDFMKFIDLLSDGTIYALSSSARYNDILDYIFTLEGYVGLNKAVNLFSLNPAIALGLDDRGCIKEGNIADFVIVDLIGENPIIDTTINKGRIVAKFNYENTF